MKEILKAFGYELRRSGGWWHACQPGKGPDDSDYAAGYWRDLIALIVPRPPIDLYLHSLPDKFHRDVIAFWARRCVDACQGEINPEGLAQAAFAAHDVVATNEELEVFIRACKAYIRWLNGELVQLS
jgi:hypothetical protein